MTAEAIAPARPGPIDHAEAIHRQVTAAPVPPSREGAAIIRQAAEYLTGEIGVHHQLVSEDMGWEEFDPDLTWHDGDRQQAAIDLAADRARETAVALQKAWAFAWLGYARACLNRAGELARARGSLRVTAAMAALERAVNTADAARVPECAGLLAGAVAEATGADDAAYVSGEDGSVTA